MRLLSLWEPWASLMAIGAKKNETRSWSTEYRGWLAIHASKGGLRIGEMSSLMSNPIFQVALKGVKLASGEIVAIVRLVDCVPTESLLCLSPRHPRLTPEEEAFGDYAPGRFAWITTDVFRLPEPIPYRGRQGLVELENSTIEHIRQQWRQSKKGAVVG